MMNISPSVIATLAALVSSGVWAHQIRGINSNHISHGQNDIRQLEGSDGVNVNVGVSASNNGALIVGNVHGDATNLFGDAVPPPTPSSQPSRNDGCVYVCPTDMSEQQCQAEQTALQKQRLQILALQEKLFDEGVEVPDWKYLDFGECANSYATLIAFLKLQAQNAALATRGNGDLTDYVAKISAITTV